MAGLLAFILMSFAFTAIAAAAEAEEVEGYGPAKPCLIHSNDPPVPEPVGQDCCETSPPSAMR